MMPNELKYNNTLKNRAEVLLKSKKTKIFFLVAVVLIIIIGALLIFLGAKDNKPTYKTVEDAIYSQYDSKQIYEIKESKKAENHYLKGEYNEAIELSISMINKGVRDEMVPGFYSVVYSSYLKLNDLQSAIKTIKDYQKTNAYKNIPKDSINYWDLDLEKLNNGINPQEEREKLENAS
jgi:hypothetical protein